jgi:hypothetical protein
MINSALKKMESHYFRENVSDSSFFGFTIGDLDPSKTFVHVLDDATLDILLQTLDTISDFVNYLTKKEKLMRRKMICAAGEEELLGYYLQHLDDRDNHDFIFEKHHVTEENFQLICFDEGIWEEFNQGQLRHAQIQANKISYAWDFLIDGFAQHMLNETQYFTTHNDIKETEIILRFMARESRLRRRILAETFCQLIDTAPQNMRRTRYICPDFQEENEPYYVFLTIPKMNWMDYEDYRIVRRDFLANCCSVVKLRFPNATHIIGIATEPGFKNGGRSEDAVYLDAGKWSIQDEINAKKIAKDLNILQELIMFSVHDHEYPTEPLTIKYHGKHFF